MNNETEIFKQSYEEMLEQSIAFRPIFVKITGNTTSAYLLSQMFFWEKSKAMAVNRRIMIDKDDQREYGYWYHTSDQLQNELFLSEKQIRESRRILRQLGILKEGFAGLPAKIYYRVDTDRLAYLVYCAKNDIQPENTEISREWKERLAVTKRNHKGLPKGTPSVTTLVTPSVTTLVTPSGSLSGNTSDTDNTDTDKKTHKRTDKEELFSQNENAFSENSKPAFTNSFPSEKTSLPTKAKKIVKEKIELSAEQKLNRKEITKFLAHKCFHASNEQEMAMLAANQIIQATKAAKNFDTKGAKASDVEALWNWFLETDWRGKKIVDAENAGNKINTAPAVLESLHLAFIKSGKASEFNSDYKYEQPIDLVDTFEIVVNACPGSDFNLVKANYLRDNPTAEAREEVRQYELSN